MSTNLWCKEVELVQTPTTITYLCYFGKFVHDEGKKCKKSDWRTILEKYLLWYRGERTSGLLDEEEYDFAVGEVKQHELELRTAAKKNKKLTFGIC